jgi:hypothetical protein
MYKLKKTLVKSDSSKYPVNMSASNASSAEVLSEDEEILVGKTEEWIKEKNSYDYALVRERFQRLRNLGKSIFDYPSIRDSQILHGVLRDEKKLAESILAFSTSSHLLRTPTKVVALRSFLVAKFHAFSLLAQVTLGHDNFYLPVKKIIFSIICTLMAEDVYFTCLEDPGFSFNTKSRLANDLIALWDSGTDPRGIRHLSALSSLWRARDSAPPSFGTMDGNTELFRISLDMDSDWQDFLLEESNNDETRWALEEFLFGLSYEEIRQVRVKLASRNVSAISYSDVRSYLDSKPAYSAVSGQDPRAIYDFFAERKEACKLRKRTSAPGPLHTLEEIYLKYRIVLESGQNY